MRFNHIYDDVIKWKHSPHYRPFVWGIHRWPVNSPHKGQWRRALMFSLICAWINGWVNNREAGDLRRHHTHYDVTVMLFSDGCRQHINGSVQDCNNSSALALELLQSCTKPSIPKYHELISYATAKSQATQVFSGADLFNSLLDILSGSSINLNGGEDVQKKKIGC